MTRSIYDHYYSGSDANIYIHYPPTGLTLHIDKAVGIGYSHSMSSSPVYGLGEVEPLFFSRGNSLVQGSLDLAFKSTEYLKSAINYLLGGEDLSQRREELELKLDSNITEEEVMELALLQSSAPLTLSTNSISEILNIFDIIIELDNTNATMDGKSYSFSLKGVKFVGQSQTIHSAEENAIVDRYTFLAKNKG